MVFSSPIFIFVFLPLTLFIYYTIGNIFSSKIFKNCISLFASLIFYAWGGIKYLPLLCSSILINYIFGLLIDKLKGKKRLKKIILLVGIMLNLILLFYYKYYDFAIGNINRISNATFQYKGIILPIGISFFTFQGMSYIIDIYRNDANVNKNIFSVALYISFFPQLIAGPIVKYKDIDNQIRKRKESMEYFGYGIERFVIGLSKKVIIADTVAGIADTIFSLSNVGIDQPTAWLGAICYTFQIYFDFSGYSDMAIGLGYMFGFKFMENFNYPYISKSITEFWRRWHISLSTWFKEYLYIPLGGNRKGNTYLNLFIVFFTTGLWHGSSWNFIAWGIWNGIFIIIEKIINKKRWYIKIPSFIKTTITMFIVILGWVLFRANGLMDAINYLLIMFGINKATTVTYQFSYFVNKKLVFWMIISIIGSTPIIGNMLRLYENKKIFQMLKTIFIGILLIISIIFIVNSIYSPFIYFQF
ncbi:alginate O-acetyltransferase [Clostridium sporogenes]|uniref:MBOAT family O-acyltransferase n=1 Tax=Clostridium sporogenes TaxID=1509 RepID=UPI000780190B|nr:MBOAT family O-acyltransferase [Clostridium sporogenes]KYN77236.1 alginate O-acetyltransferase [Clostridium sporogenes]MCW6060734.1 MBOAT family protein [Clostridium sporogenes]MCW6069320.1 MBOAT family protein [Clostridium sporogenes]